MNPGFCKDPGAGRSRSRVDSRAKGRRGELDACRALEEVTTLEWRTTAQRWGKAKADIEPVDGGVGLHVEVKLYGTGLTWWQRRAERQPVSMAGEMYFCQLNRLRDVVDQATLPENAPRCMMAERWMRKATSDAEQGIKPLLLCRQDRCEWLAAWHMADDDAICTILRGIMR